MNASIMVMLNFVLQVKWQRWDIHSHHAQLPSVELGFSPSTLKVINEAGEDVLLTGLGVKI